MTEGLRGRTGSSEMIEVRIVVRREEFACDAPLTAIS